MGLPRKYLGHGICDARSKLLNLKQATASASDLTVAALQLLKEARIPPDKIRGVGLQMTRLIPAVGSNGTVDSGGGSGALHGWLTKMGEEDSAEPLQEESSPTGSKGESVRARPQSRSSPKRAKRSLEAAQESVRDSPTSRDLDFSDHRKVNHNKFTRIGSTTSGDDSSSSSSSRAYSRSFPNPSVDEGSTSDAVTPDVYAAGVQDIALGQPRAQSETRETPPVALLQRSNAKVRSKDAIAAGAKRSRLEDKRAGGGGETAASAAAAAAPEHRTHGSSNSSSSTSTRGSDCSRDGEGKSVAAAGHARRPSPGHRGSIKPDRSPRRSLPQGRRFHEESQATLESSARTRNRGGGGDQEQRFRDLRCPASSSTAAGESPAVAGSPARSRSVAVAQPPSEVRTPHVALGGGRTQRKRGFGFGGEEAAIGTATFLQEGKAAAASGRGSGESCAVKRKRTDVLEKAWTPRGMASPMSSPMMTPASRLADTPASGASSPSMSQVFSFVLCMFSGFCFVFFCFHFCLFLGFLQNFCLTFPPTQPLHIACHVFNPKLLKLCFHQITFSQIDNTVLGALPPDIRTEVVLQLEARQRQREENAGASSMPPTTNARDSGGSGGKGGRHIINSDAAIAALLSATETDVSVRDTAGGGEGDNGTERGQVPIAPVPFIREGLDVTVRDGPGKTQQVRGRGTDDVCFVMMNSLVGYVHVEFLLYVLGLRSTDMVCVCACVREMGGSTSIDVFVPLGHRYMDVQRATFLHGIPARATMGRFGEM